MCDEDQPRRDRVVKPFQKLTPELREYLARRDLETDQQARASAMFDRILLERLMEEFQ